MKIPFWSGLAVELKLSPEEQAKFRLKVQAKRDALRDFDQSHAQTIAELTRTFDAQKNDRNKKDNAKATRAAIVSLRETRAKLQQQHQERILSTLNPDQLVRYESYRLYEILRKYFSAAQPGEKQKVSLRALADVEGAKMTKISRGDSAARDTLTTNLILKARSQVQWTPRQVYALDDGGRSSHIRLPGIEEEENP
jgi:hypothetical protein